MFFPFKLRMYTNTHIIFDMIKSPKCSRTNTKPLNSVLQVCVCTIPMNVIDFLATVNPTKNKVPLVSHHWCVAAPKTSAATRLHMKTLFGKRKKDSLQIQPAIPFIIFS